MNSKKGQAVLRERIDSRATFNVFLTVTLRQALINDGLGFTWISEDDCRKAAWLLRDRLTKKVNKSAGLARSTRLPFAVFIEGYGRFERFHFHALSVKPDNVSFAQYQCLIMDVCGKLDWVYRKVKVQPIDFSDSDAVPVITYCLKKEGIEGRWSFCPEASFL